MLNNVYKINKLSEILKSNPYPGRGIVMGKSSCGKYAVCAYFIMGRSENSRNRIFEKKDGTVFTKAYDESKVEDSSLIIYAALRSFENKLIVTNGDQTDTIYEGLKEGDCFGHILERREFEPDEPNFTPRISAMATFEDGDFIYKMSILKSIDQEGSGCQRHSFSYPSTSGLGHFLHTYESDGNPLPSFCGEPRRIEIQGDLEAFANDIWDSLDEQNKISLYVRFTDLKTGEISDKIINKER